MPKRPRSSRNQRSNANRSEYIPEPPSRHDFERQQRDIWPNPDQRLLGYKPQPMSDREALDQLDRKTAEARVLPPPTQSIVAMTCSVKKSAFAVRFERHHLLSWHVTDTFLLGHAKGVASAKSESVPVSQMDFSKAVCPACGAGCRPILCGGCKRFVCDGGVMILPSAEKFHRCACGAMGTLTPTLKTISAANGTDAREPGSDRSTSPGMPLLLRFRGE
jgi:hypothetical protein